MLSVLWDFAAKKKYVSLESKNPMDLVKARKRPGKKRRLPMKDMSKEQFAKLIENMDFMLQVLFTIQVNLASEARGLKWCDVDWLNKEIAIERGVVGQVVDAVKTDMSHGALPVRDAVLEMLKAWRVKSEFKAETDWIFASSVNTARHRSVTRSFGNR